MPSGFYSFVTWAKKTKPMSDEIERNLSDRDEVKKALKEALKEWLDSKYAELGKWSLHAIAAAVLAALTYFILTMNGWHKGP